MDVTLNLIVYFVAKKDKKQIMKLFKIMLLVVISMMATDRCEAEYAYVVRVIDGDTFVTSDGTIIRVKNIDTPETNHPKIGSEPGGNEATKLAKFYLEHKFVWLDGKSHDKYGRRLSTVVVGGGLSYADIVKSHGYDKNSNNIYTQQTPYSNSQWKSSLKPITSLPKPSISFKGSTWVNGYIKSDGTWVSGHWKNNSSSTNQNTYLAPSSSVPKIQSFSTEGKVKVKGYYRKDGTYVQPHTRSKRSK